MVRMSNMKLLISLISMLAMASGCAYESPQPIFPAGRPIADRSLVGRWTCTSPNEPETTATISESRPREYSIELSAPGRNTVRLRGSVARAGQTTVLNLQQIEGTDLISKDQYAAVRYTRKADGSLDVAVLKSREGGVTRYDQLLHCVH